MNLPLHQSQRRVDQCLEVPVSEGPLRVLGCESQLGPRPVALRLRVDGSEGQVDAWASVMVLFSHLMLVDTQRQTRFTLYIKYVRARLLSSKISMKVRGRGSDGLSAFKFSSAL